MKCSHHWRDNCRGRTTSSSSLTKLLRPLVAEAERWLMRRFDVVSTISQRLHQCLLVVVPPGVAPKITCTMSLSLTIMR